MHHSIYSSIVDKIYIEGEIDRVHTMSISISFGRRLRLPCGTKLLQQLLLLLLLTVLLLAAMHCGCAAAVQGGGDQRGRRMLREGVSAPAPPMPNTLHQTNDPTACC
jgi:hypothetical protein